MNVRKSISLAVPSFALLIASQFSNAATVEGVIKGAQCHFNNQFCVTSQNDPHLRLESEFLLVTGDGYFFLSNLSRDEKSALNNKSVKISGDAIDKDISVDQIQVKAGYSYQTVWDWNDIYASNSSN